MSSKEQLLVDVSHELRTPLTRLKVQLAMVPDPETRQSLNADVAEMESMVTAILEEARLRSTAAELQRKSVDMADLLKSVVEEFQNRPPGAVCGPMMPATVLLDGEKMRTVLRNLIDNAVKHTPADGPPVEVSLVPDDGHCRRSPAPPVRALLPRRCLAFPQDGRFRVGPEYLQSHHRRPPWADPRRQQTRQRHPGDHHPCANGVVIPFLISQTGLPASWVDWQVWQAAISRSSTIVFQIAIYRPN